MGSPSGARKEMNVPATRDQPEEPAMMAIVKV